MGLFCTPKNSTAAIRGLVLSRGFMFLTQKRWKNKHCTHLNRGLRAVFMSLAKLELKPMRVDGAD